MFKNSIQLRTKEICFYNSSKGNREDHRPQTMQKQLLKHNLNQNPLENQKHHFMLLEARALGCDVRVVPPVQGEEQGRVRQPGRVRNHLHTI